jgi:hypothetical protein
MGFLTTRFAADDMMISSKEEETIWKEMVH